MSYFPSSCVPPCASCHLLIFYKEKSDLDLIGFTDSDWEGDSTDRKSTSGYVFMLIEGPISWSSKKQSAIALSSTEAEYRGVVNAATQCLWLQGLLGECGFEPEYSTTIYCDNQSTIQICKYPVQKQRPNTLRSICTT